MPHADATIAENPVKPASSALATETEPEPTPKSTTSSEDVDVQALQAKVEALSDEINGLYEQLESADAERQPLRRSLSSKEQAVTELTARVADLERRLAHDKSEYEKAVSTRDQSIDALQTKVHELKREMNVLTDDYESVSEEKRDLEVQLDKEHTQLINLQDELAEMDTLVAELREEIERLKQRGEQDAIVMEEAQTAAAAAAQLHEASAAETSAKLLALTEANAALEAALAAASSGHANGINQYKEQLAALTAQVEASAATAKSSEQRQKSLEAECAALKASLDEFHAAAASVTPSHVQEDLEMKVAQLEAAKTTQEHEWAKTERSWKKQVQELTERYDEAASTSLELQRSRDHAVTMNEHLSAEVDALNKGRIWNPVIHAVCLFAGLAFGIKAFHGPLA